MSVRFESKNDDTFDVSLCNADLSALIACANAYSEKIPVWNGCHDGQEYTPHQLRVMAMRAKQIGDLHDVLLELADNGGATVN